MSTENDKLPAGSIRIEAIQIISDLGGEPWDIQHIVQELSIYESLTSPFLTADIVVFDALSLTSIIPLVGQEMVHIKFKTPTNAVLKPIDVTLRIVSIENLARNRARTANYIIHLASQEHFENIKTRIMKSYRQMPISDMITDIHSVHLASQKELTALTTDGQRTIVIPNMHPTRAISFLSREAKNPKPDHAPNYIYFENCDGFFFTTIDELLTKRPVGPIDEYWSTIKDNDHGSPRAASSGRGAASKQSSKPFEMLKIDKFEFIQLFNADQTAMKGGWENTLHYIDPIYSEFGTKNYNYFTDFDKMRHLGKPGKRGKLISENNHMIGTGGSNVNYFMTNKSGSGVDTDQKWEFYHIRKASMALMDSILVEVTIPGDSERRAGHRVNLQFPEFGATDDIEGDVNRYVSGEYLVMAVRHIYTTSGYFCVMQCAKNAYEEELVPENNPEGLQELNPENPALARPVINTETEAETVDPQFPLTFNV